MVEEKKPEEQQNDKLLHEKLQQLRSEEHTSELQSQR